MNRLKKKDLLTLGFMMFSVFFGAGNLIFPPALGQAAGRPSEVEAAGKARSASRDAGHSR